MGILGLAKVISEKAPQGVKENELKNYFGRRIAIDASMSIYQFLIAMKGFQDGQGTDLTNEDGEVTSHLNGLWARTIRMMEEGLKPIYVFDGKPPELKRKELEQRRAKAAEAQKELEQAKENDEDDEAIEKLGKRTVRLSREQSDECKKMLRLMGIPVVEASSEAEAQCAELVRGGKAWAVATEDMDALTFGAPRLLRHLTYSEAKKRPIAEYDLSAILAQTGLEMDSFIDFCILLGCDYCPKITGVGPVKAFDGIVSHKSIEAFIASLDTTKYNVSQEFLESYLPSREFFKKPDVVPAADVTIEFKQPEADALLEFMVTEKKFNRERIEKGIARLRAALQTKTQGRLDQFFTITPKALPAVAGAKRPAEGGAAVEGKLRKKETNAVKKAVRK